MNPGVSAETASLSLEVFASKSARTDLSAFVGGCSSPRVRRRHPGGTGPARHPQRATAVGSGQAGAAVTVCSTAASSRRVRGTAAEVPVTRAVTRTVALPAETAVTVTVVLDADTCTNGSDEVAEWTTVLPGPAHRTARSPPR